MFQKLVYIFTVMASGSGAGSRCAGLLPGGVAHQRYHCDVCNDPIISYDLKHHYKNFTNFDQLEKLMGGMEEKKVQVTMGVIKAHTRYM